MKNIKIETGGVIEKKLPANLEAEQSVIGSVLVNNDIIDEISSIIKSNNFFDPAHKKIYELIEDLNNKGMIANPITLKNYLEKNETLSEVGGIDYLVKLTRFSSSIKQAIDYAKIVREMYVKRELILISEDVMLKQKMIILRTPQTKLLRKPSNHCISLLKKDPFLNLTLNLIKLWSKQLRWQR